MEFINQYGDLGQYVLIYQTQNEIDINKPVFVVNNATPKLLFFVMPVLVFAAWKSTFLGNGVTDSSSVMPICIFAGSIGDNVGGRNLLIVYFEIIYSHDPQ